jgi:hypothetical protein
MEASESNQIYEAFKFARRVGDEIDALHGAVKDELLKASEQPGAEYSFVHTDAQQKPTARSDYWVCEVWGESFSVSEKRKPKRLGLGYLYYVYDLSWESGPASQLKQAVIMVGYASVRASKAHPQNMTIDAFYPWEPTILDDRGKRWLLAKDKRAWFWNGGTSDFSDVDNTCWVYFVPLAGIHNQRDVADVLVTPALGLLTNRQQTLTNVAPVIRFAENKFEQS